MPAILLMASAAALLHSTMVTSAPLAPEAGPSGPTPQNGVWALVPSVDCAVPTSLDISTWPKCATPIGFLDGEVAALERPGPGKKAKADEFYSIARTKFVMVPGVPATADAKPGAAPVSAAAVAQVVVPMIFSRSYYYLSITPVALDTDGHFAEAKGWPVACLPKDQGGCNPKTLADVQAQAAMEPTDPARLYKLVRIQPAAATPPANAPAAPADGSAPATAPTTAPPVPGTVTETTLPPATPPAPAATPAPATATPSASPPAATPPAR